MGGRVQSAKHIGRDCYLRPRPFTTFLYGNVPVAVAMRVIGTRIGKIVGNDIVIEQFLRRKAMFTGIPIVVEPAQMRELCFRENDFDIIAIVAGDHENAGTHETFVGGTRITGYGLNPFAFLDA